MPSWPKPRDSAPLARITAWTLVLTYASAVPAQSVFHSDFETDHATWAWYTHTIDGGGIRIGELATQESRVGASSARFIMDRSQGGLFHRAMFRKTDGFLTGSDERWIGFSTFFPRTGPDAWKVDPLPELIFQLHNDPDASPILGLYCEAGKLGVEYRWSAIDPASNADVSTVDLPVGPQEPGRWVDWVFHVKLAPSDAGGILEVWKTDSLGTSRKLVDLHGIRLGYPNGQLPAIDIGLYKWPWKTATYNGVDSDVDRRVVYFDEFRLAGAEGSRLAVSPPSLIGMLLPSRRNAAFPIGLATRDAAGRARAAIPFVPTFPSP